MSKNKNVFGKSREERIAEYIIENGATVRAAGQYFGISKSTVHKDVSKKLAESNAILYGKVKAVLDKNKSERHKRGGEATRLMYLERRLNK